MCAWSSRLVLIFFLGCFCFCNSQTSLSYRTFMKAICVSSQSFLLSQQPSPKASVCQFREGCYKAKGRRICPPPSQYMHPSPLNKYNASSTPSFRCLAQVVIIFVSLAFFRLLFCIVMFFVLHRSGRLLFLFFIIIIFVAC